MAVDVRIYPEHVESLKRARQALEGERLVCLRWGSSMGESITLAIEDLDELIRKAEDVPMERVSGTVNRPW